MKQGHKNKQTFALLREISVILRVMVDPLYNGRTWSSLNETEQSVYIKKHYVTDIDDLPDNVKEIALHNEQTLVDELLIADKTLSPQKLEQIKQQNALRFNSDGTAKQIPTN